MCQQPERQLRSEHSNHLREVVSSARYTILMVSGQIAIFMLITAAYTSHFSCVRRSTQYLVAPHCSPSGGYKQDVRANNFLFFYFIYFSCISIFPIAYVAQLANKEEGG